MSNGSNGIDGEKANRFVAEIERCDDELLSERMGYASRCRPIQERKKDWKQRASDDGVPVRALNKILGERKHLRAIAKINAEVDDLDDKATLKELRELLEPVAGLPLFAAALEEAERKADAADAKPRGGKGRGRKKGESAASEAGKGDALDSLISDEASEAARVKEAEERLGGMKSLD